MSLQQSYKVSDPYTKVNYIYVIYDNMKMKIK